MEGLCGRGWHGRERGREGKVWGAKREREKQKDIWPQTQAAKGERKCKGEDQRTKNWGLKCLKEGSENETERRWRSAVVKRKIKSEELKRTGKIKDDCVSIGKSEQLYV